MNSAVLHRSAVDDAAVGENGLSGDVVRIGAGQERHQRRHIIRRLCTTEGDAFHVLLVRLTLRGAGERGKPLVDLHPHVGADDTGAVRIHRDTGAGILFRGGLRETTHGELGG